MTVEQQIQERNDQFNGASAVVKRCLLAHDVIQLIEQKRLTAKSGDFFHLNDDERVLLSRLTGGLQERFLDGSIPRCRCCALGGLMLSCTLFNSNESVEDLRLRAGDFARIGCNIVREEGFQNGLTDVFGFHQLKLIENAFECGEGYFQDELEEYELEEMGKAAAFGERFEDDEERLIAIMKNIIEYGEFRP